MHNAALTLQFTHLKVYWGLRNRHGAASWFLGRTNLHKSNMADVEKNNFHENPCSSSKGSVPVSSQDRWHHCWRYRLFLRTFGLHISLTEITPTKEESECFLCLSRCGYQQKPNSVYDMYYYIVIDQYLKQGAVGFVLPLIFEVSYVDCCDSPLLLCCRVQYYLKSRKTCTHTHTHTISWIRTQILFCS